MAETVACPGCATKLKLKPEYAGKKIKCPRCGHMMRIPVGGGVVAGIPKAGKAAPTRARAVPADDEDAALATRPGKKRKGKSDMSPCPECGEMVDNAATKCPHCKTRLEVDEEAEYQKWKKCPHCGQRMGKRVLWTLWGSFYFTALFKHVRCDDCGTTYNGATGTSNLGLAIVCLSVEIGLFGAVGLLIQWLFQSRGYVVKDWIGFTSWSVIGVGGAGLLTGIVLKLMTGRK